MPDHILKYTGSKCRFKSPDIYPVIESYAEAFTVGYLPVFHPGEIFSQTQTLEMFCHFIVLAFPPSKVEEILNTLEETNQTSLDFGTLRRALNSREKTSKKYFVTLAQENPCFRTIILKLSDLNEVNEQGKEVENQILRDIANPLAPQRA